MLDHPLGVLAIADEEAHLDTIRRFFLQPQETYSVEDLAVLWRTHPDDVRDIYHDQLLRHANNQDDTDSPGIAWADAMGASVTFNILRPFDIERALGADFTRARPETWRTVPVLIHLPAFIADAIALDASIPPKLRIEVRIEQILVELFRTGECAAGRASDDEPARWPE